VQKKLNQSCDQRTIKARLPPINSRKQAAEDEVAKFLKLNQVAQQQPQQQKQQLRQPEEHDYEDVRNLSQQALKKEDKNELLSQYFSAKRSMKL